MWSMSATSPAMMVYSIMVYNFLSCTVAFVQSLQLSVTSRPKSKGGKTVRRHGRSPALQDHEKPASSSSTGRTTRTQPGLMITTGKRARRSTSNGSFIETAKKKNQVASTTAKTTSSRKLSWGPLCLASKIVRLHIIAMAVLAH